MSGRAIVTCDGTEVHNSVMRGVNMVVDVTWNFRAKSSSSSSIHCGVNVMRIVAHASSASSKVKGGSRRQYELFVNGVSYFNFLSVDQLKVNSGGGGVVNTKRPVQRHSMFEKGGPNYNTEYQGTDMRRHSDREIGRHHRRPEYYTSPPTLDSGVSSSRRKSSLVSVDESETSRLSYQSDMSPLDGSVRSSSRIMGKQMQRKSNVDESDRSARSRDSSSLKHHTHHKTILNSTPTSSIDQSDRSSSRRQKMIKSKSAIDRSDRSSRSDRCNIAQSRSRTMDESDRSARSRDFNPRLQSHLPVHNNNNDIYKPMAKSRRQTIMSTSSEQTQKVTNKTSSKVPGQVYCEDDDDDDNNSVDTMKWALRTSFISVAKSLSPPEGNVTIVYTDVQGSTLLWESCPSAMKKAQDIHDTIMRQCYSNHKGYEISTEGDSFNVAFQHPVDALAFALQAQIKLYKADWPQEILNHPDGKEEPYLKFKGLRVRFGINHGPTTNQIHRITGRMIYAGEGVKIAKAMEGLCHGGQILCTIETWKAVGGLAERYLGRPQVMDCGEHVLFDANRTRYSRRIMQIVPNELAFDFFEARGQAEDGTVKDASLVRGRLFPPLPSKKQLSTCFLNAPYVNGRVVICFVHTVGLGDEDGSENRIHNLLKLAKNVRKLLLRSDPPGYECQEDNGCWMLAFGSVDKAVLFGVQLMESIREGGAKEHLLGDVDCQNMYKIGIVSGPFTSMGPHKTSGLADYFGPIVNRAARVASSCEPGQLCIGIPLANGARIAPPNFGPSIQVRLLGIRQLKGVSVDVAVYGCSKCIMNV